MFCFQCGKTIPENQTTCPHCSAEVGRNRFPGMPYTSAQPRFEADGSANHAQSLGYTRITYTDMKDEERGESDAGTTYRPAYNIADVPDDMCKEMLSEVEKDKPKIKKQAEEEKQKPDEHIPHAPIPTDEQFQRTIEDLVGDGLDMDMEDMDLSQFKTRPMQFREQTGISEDVTEYMKQLADAKERRGNRRSALGNLKFHLPRKNSEENSEEAADYDDYRTDEDAEAVSETDAPMRGVSSENAPDGDAEAYEDEEYEEQEGNAILRLKRVLPDLPKVVKIAVALVLAAALVFGGVTWIRYISKKSVRAPIEGVTLEYYNAGIEMLEGYAAQEHIDQLVALYNSEGLVSMNTTLSSEAIALAALAPTTPDTNDALFGQALSAIETNIGNALTMDVLTMGTGSDADSAARWNVVNSSIAQLKAATSASELTGIINGQKISSAPTPTPVPTPAPYKTLSNGDKSDAVLDLQNRLYELGFFSDERDGAYGNKTMTAVKLFQEAADLPVTGIADAATQEALYASDAPKGSAAN